MATTKDFSNVGRFRADDGFKIFTRGGQVVASPVLMKPVIRSAGGRTFTVPVKFQFRWDLLANELLGDVALKWVLMRHNRIADPFFFPYAGQQILVPSSSELDYYLNR